MDGGKNEIRLFGSFFCIEKTAVRHIDPAEFRIGELRGRIFYTEIHGIAILKGKGPDERNRALLFPVSR